MRALDSGNVLQIDTSRGRVLVEMRPDMASASVARVKLLARQKVYDGLQFHRVAVLKRLNVGEPPTQPDLMLQVRVLADIPASQRVRISIAHGAQLAAVIAAARSRKGADFSVCDVEVAAQVDLP